MQVDTQRFLELMERAGAVAIVDIEATGLKGDYNSVLVVSIKPYHKSPTTFRVTRPGRDRKLLKSVRSELQRYEVWVTYYGKRFDIPMLNTRLLRWGMSPIPKRPHIDLYFTLKSSILTAHRSQGHLLSWLQLPEEKMTVSATVWNEVLAHPRKNIAKLVERCESDVAGLEALYDRTKHLVIDVRK